MKPRLIPHFACAIWLLTGHPQAFGDEGGQWEAFGPVAATQEMVALVDDPDEIARFWLAGASTVWVTNDGGQTFEVIFDTPLGRGSSRASHVLADDDDLFRDLDGFDSTDIEARQFDTLDPFDPHGAGDETDEGWSGEDLEGPTEGAELTGPAELAEAGLGVPEDEDAEGDGPSADRLEPFVREHFGITRLRVIGSELWICTSRGLWRVPRVARSLGAARGVRLGRRLGSNDVIAAGPQRVIVATDAGVWAVNARGGAATRMRGIGYDVTVTALASDARDVFAATSRGLYRADQDTTTFTRVGGGQRTDGLRDVWVGADKIVSTDGQGVFTYQRDTGNLLGVTQVSGIQRFFTGARGRLWAVSERGLWLESADGWLHAGHSLGDPRLNDGGERCVADSCASTDLRVVGAGGAWRARRQGAVSALAEAQNPSQERYAAAIAARPSLRQLIAKAESQRTLTLQEISTFKTRERLSWLLPTLAVRVSSGAARETEWSYIPALGRHTIDSVGVAPLQAAVEVMAYWDLMPATLVALDLSQSHLYEGSRAAARETQRHIREALPPLWRRWATLQVALWQAEPETPRTAVRAALEVAQLEAQLHALTAGEFPVTGDVASYLFHKE